jgi:hypothetical protein
MISVIFFCATGISFSYDQLQPLFETLECSTGIDHRNTVGEYNEIRDIVNCYYCFHLVFYTVVS